jgi:N-acetylglucosaminyldiphosphoundecaprenol N-acetyl-beta-D-mannosaminyltransferase
MKLNDFKLFEKTLSDLEFGKLLITTINAYSYYIMQKDETFCEALQKSDVLLPDGISIVWAKRFLNGVNLKKIAGADLFYFEINRLNNINGKCFFLGSTEKTLQIIKEKVANDFPNVEVYAYSPPYKPEFSTEDNLKMIQAVNEIEPDVLFIGMTAPKQEKWAYQHFKALNTGHVCCIGAVFDFYAGTVNRAPRWMIKLGLEWFYRLVKEPKRMWRRYLIGNVKFILLVVKEKMMHFLN